MAISGNSYWEVLRIYLILKKIRQIDFASAISMDRSQLSEALNSDRKPQKKTRDKIESYLAVKIEQTPSGRWELNRAEEYLAGLTPEEKYKGYVYDLDECVNQLEEIISAYKATKRGMGKSKAEKNLLFEGFKSRLTHLSKRYGADF